jgi:hypothetical protein
MTFIQSLKPGSATVQSDLACRRCSYNLKGLKSPGVCPECGTPFHLGRRFASSFNDVPMASLRASALWVNAMVGSGAVLGVGLLIAVFLSAMDMKLTVIAPVLVLLAGAWAATVLMVTWPWAGFDDVTRPEPQRRNKVLRIVVWAMALAGFAGACLFALGEAMLASQISTSTAPLAAVAGSLNGLFAIAWLCAVVAWLGVLMLGLYLGGMAEWYEDYELCERFRAGMFLIFVVPLPLMWMVSVPARGILTAPAWGVACIGLIVLTVLLTRPFVGLAMVARWALKSADLSLGHELRSARKIIERIEGGKAKPDAPPARDIALPLVKQGLVEHGPVAPRAPVGPPSHVKRHPPDPKKRPSV